MNSLTILSEGKYGVLALDGDEGYPYSVPLNYVFKDGAIYFHCAKRGHKIDAITRNDKASFCAVAKSDLIAEKFTTFFKSVIAFGRIHVVENRDERIFALEALVEALSPDELPENKSAEIEHCRKTDSVAILAFEIEHMTGKQAIELLNAAND